MVERIGKVLAILAWHLEVTAQESTGLARADYDHTAESNKRVKTAELVRVLVLLSKFTISSRRCL